MVSSIDKQARQLGPVSAAPGQEGRVAALERLLGRHQPADRFQLVGPDGEAEEIPGAVLEVLGRAVSALVSGEAVRVISMSEELTTGQAADLLNVSRQYLVRLLDDGKIPFSLVGTHRRVRAADVLDYKDARDRNRRSKLNELVRLSEEFGGYEEVPGGSTH